MPIPDTDPIVNIPIVTPFIETGDVDHAALENNMQRWLQTPAAGFLVGSQTGEEWCLSEAEKLTVAKTVHESLSGRGFLMGGIDCPSTLETLRRAEAFAEVGAEVVRVRFPRHPSLVEPYFEEVLPRCPVPVLLMHQCEPARFGQAAAPAATPEVLGAVVDRDNVFGYVTDHDVRFETGVRRCIQRDDRRFWICNGSLILHGTLIGCNGTTTAFSNIWPQALDDLLRLGMAGRYDEAKKLQDLVQRIDAVMLPYLAAGVKATLQLMGFEGMHPRQPSRELSDATLAELRALLDEAQLLS